MYRQFFRPKTFWLNHLKKEISAKGPPADGARSIAPQFPGKFERSDAPRSAVCRFCRGLQRGCGTLELSRRKPGIAGACPAEASAKEYPAGNASRLRHNH